VEELHARIAAVELAAVGPFGFALAGGYAVQVHGLLHRRSDDVDLFTDRLDPVSFARAVRAAVAAYREAGFGVGVEVSAEAFARLLLTDPAGRSAKVELACDWRAHPPVLLEIGPVLHPDDAVADGSSSARSPGSASTAAAYVTTRPCPNTTRPWSTSP
jgi:hypothetical protein